MGGTVFFGWRGLEVGPIKRERVERLKQRAKVTGQIGRTMG